VGEDNENDDNVSADYNVCPQINCIKLVRAKFHYASWLRTS